MIICSLPRCGATKIGMDLASQHSLEFVGELNPNYLDYMFDSRKSKHHETKFQPQYSESKLYSALTYDNKFVVLVNTMPYLIVNKADYIILRRNMVDAFLSTANFLIKTTPNIRCETIIHRLLMMNESLAGIWIFLKNTDFSKVVWYEDYFNKSGTNTRLLESYKYKSIIYKYIQEFSTQRHMVEFMEYHNG